MTGDVLFFANNAPTGFLLRTFTSSPWNHVGVAVRIGPGGISLSRRGALHVLEINTGKRLDALSGEMTVGAAVTEFGYVKRLYNTIAVRRLAPKWRDAGLGERTKAFAEYYRGVRFTSSTLPFLSVWLGISLSDPEPAVGGQPDQMFCSELVARYYTECFAKSLAELFGAEGAVPHPRRPLAHWGGGDFQIDRARFSDGSGARQGRPGSGGRPDWTTAWASAGTPVPGWSPGNWVEPGRLPLQGGEDEFHPQGTDRGDSPGEVRSADEPDHPPEDPHLYTPNHFTKSLTPHAAVFDGPEEIIYTAPADIGVVLFQPLLIALVVIVLIGMTMPKGESKGGNK